MRIIGTLYGKAGVSIRFYAYNCYKKDIMASPQRQGQGHLCVMPKISFSSKRNVSTHHFFLQKVKMVPKVEWLSIVLCWPFSHFLILRWNYCILFFIKKYNHNQKVANHFKVIHQRIKHFCHRKCSIH